jgi:hypothetical protein
MAPKILSFTEARFENHVVFREAKNVARTITVGYPDIPMSFALHACLATLSLRFLDQVDKWNWTDAKGADCFPFIPPWKNTVSAEDMLEQTAVPIGALLRLAEMAEIPLRLALVSQTAISDEWVVLHTDTKEFKKLDERVEDPPRLWVELSEKDIHSIQETPHEDPAFRIGVLVCDSVSMNRMTSQESVISGIAGCVAELIHGASNSVFSDVIERSIDEETDEETGVIRALYDDLEPEERELFPSFEIFESCIISFGNGGDDTYGNPTNRVTQRNVIASLISEEVSEENES